MAELVFLPAFLLILGAGAGVATLFHYLKLPTIVGLILAGVIIGPSGFGLMASVPGIHFVSELGSVLLLFTLGLEFSFKRLKDLRHVFLKVGVVQVLGTALLVALLAWPALGIGARKAIFLGLLVSLSSTALVMKLLEDARELGSAYGNASVGVLLFQDLAFIPIVMVLPLLAGGTTADGVAAVAPVRWLVMLGLTVAGTWLGSRRIVPFVLDRVAQTRSRELFAFAILLLCFGVAYLVSRIGLSLPLGAFIAGVMISESPSGRQVAADIGPLRDCLLGVFFLSVGMLVDLGFLGAHLPLVVLAGTGAFAAKVVATFGAMRLARYPASLSMIVALMLCQIGEFSFILAQQGLGLGLFGAEDHQIFLAVSVVSMMATPFLFRLAPRIGLDARFEQMVGRAIRRRVEEGSSPAGASGHTLIIGFGLAGQNVARAMRALQIPYRVLELTTRRSAGTSPRASPSSSATRPSSKCSRTRAS